LDDDYRPLRRVYDDEGVMIVPEPEYPPYPLRVKAFIYACGRHAAEMDSRKFTPTK